MAKTRKYLTHDIEIHEGNDAVIVRAPFDTLITISPWGMVTIEHNGRKVKIVGVDSGPAGGTIYVEGPHTDGSP